MRPRNTMPYQKGAPGAAESAIDTVARHSSGTWFEIAARAGHLISPWHTGESGHEPKRPRRAASKDTGISPPTPS